MADPTPAELIAQASTATAQALAQALGGLKIGPTSSVKLSKFYGHPQKAGDLTVKEWLDEVEVYTRQMGHTDAAKATALIDHLGGAAKEEVLCASEAVKGDYVELTSLLRKRFGPAETLHSLTRAFNDRVRQDGESLADYSRTLMRLYSRMEKSAPKPEDLQALERLRDISLKGQFRKGVNNDSVSRDIERIEIREPDKTFPELREEVLRLYQDQELKRTRVRQVGHSGGLHESVMAEQVLTNHDSQVQAILESQRATNQHLEKLIGMMNKVTSPSTYTGVDTGGYPHGHPPSMQCNNSRGNQPPFRKRGACFFCGKEGHFKRDCRAWQRARRDSSPATQGGQSVARENFQASGMYSARATFTVPPTFPSSSNLQPSFPIPPALTSVPPQHILERDPNLQPLGSRADPQRPN